MYEKTSPSEYLVISRGQWDRDASRDEIQSAIDRFYAWHDQLVDEGRMKAGQRLGKEAKTVSKQIVTDGPFGETKEVIGGYWFILANSLEEAAKLAAENPCLAYGLAYEIRPIESVRASAFTVTTETPAGTAANPEQLLTGRCLCEGVAYQIEGELGPIFHCHCSKCRRWHGAAFRTRATIKASQFKWTTGEDLVVGYHSSEFVVKHFCSVCGSNLISTYDNDPNKIGIPLGGLDQAPNNKPEGHFFVDSKAPWFEITDGLPQYETWPGSHAKVRETSDGT